MIQPSNLINDALDLIEEDLNMTGNDHTMDGEYSESQAMESSDEDEGIKAQQVIK